MFDIWIMSPMPDVYSCDNYQIGRFYVQSVAHVHALHILLHQPPLLPVGYTSCLGKRYGVADY